MSKVKSSPPPKASVRSTSKGGACLIWAWLFIVGAIVIAFGLAGWLIFSGAGRAVTELPELQDNTSPELVAARREQDQSRLNSYGWVDEEADVVRIPIEQAMSIIAEDGLPVGSVATATPTPEPTATSTPAPDNTAEPSIEATPTPEPSPTPTVDLANVSFNDHVLPIFEQHCTECHGGDDPEEGLRLTSFDEVMAGSWNGSVIEPGDVEGSYLIDQIVSGRMPKRGPKVSSTEIEIISAWVSNGALNN